MAEGRADVAAWAGRAVNMHGEVELWRGVWAYEHGGEHGGSKCGGGCSPLGAWSDKNSGRSLRPKAVSAIIHLSFPRPP